MTGELGLADVLSEFARTMVTDFPIQAILDRLVERIVDIMPVAGAGVTLITPQLRPRYVAASDNSALRFEELQTELREGPCVTAYQTGQPVAVLDLRTEDRFPNFTPRALAAGMMAVFTFPLRHGDHQLGALDLYRGTSGTLSERDMTSAQTLADVAAAYLLNAQSRQELQQASERSRGQPCMMRSPDWPIGSCCWSASSMPSSEAAARAKPQRCSSSTSMPSRWSTTATVTA
jgi:GAF domain-containing protein